MLKILFADNYLASVDKTAGVLVHRTGLDAGETRFVLQMLRDQLQRPVWPVHRLDKGTSGVLLFALHAEVARALGEQFERAGRVRKTYTAMVRGWPDAQGTIDHPLRRLDDDARATREAVQPALTRYAVQAWLELPLASSEFATTRAAQVRLEPETGRRHQLRRHLKHIAHPIMGDATHGKGPLNRALAELLGHQRRGCMPPRWPSPIRSPARPCTCRHRQGRSGHCGNRTRWPE